MRCSGIAFLFLQSTVNKIVVIMMIIMLIIIIIKLFYINFVMFYDMSRYQRFIQNPVNI